MRPDDIPMMSPTPKNIIELLRVSTDLQDVARQRTDLERLKKRLTSVHFERWSCMVFPARPRWTISRSSKY